MAKPEPISVDHIGLAVSGYLRDSAATKVTLYVTSAKSVGLSRHSHQLADLVERGTTLRIERCKHVAKIGSVFCVPVKVGTGRQSWCCNLVHHCSVPKDREIKIASVERDELRLQIINLVYESGDQLLLGSISDMRSTEGFYCPMTFLVARNECADANNGVVNVLRKFIPDCLTNLLVSLAVEAIGAGKAPRSGTVSMSHTMTDATKFSSD